MKLLKTQIYKTKQWGGIFTRLLGTLQKTG